MVLHEEKQRVKTLLTDTITLLCRNGLTFKNEFNISALIGITLDKENVFLVDIRETIKHQPLSDDGDSDESSMASTEHSKQRRRRRKRSSGSVESISGSDDDMEPGEKRASTDVKQESDKTNNDDLVFIKDEPGQSSSNQNSFSTSTPLAQGNSSQSSMYNSSMSAVPPWENFVPPHLSKSSLPRPQGPAMLTIPGSDPGQSPLMIKPTQTRRTHTVDKRYAIIKEVEEGMMKKTHIARKYNIPQNTLSTWIKNAEKIKEGFENSSFTGMLKMRPGSFPDVEKHLKDWVVQMEGMGNYVSQQCMREKAQEIALALGHLDFRGSSTWLRQFKRRNGWIKRKRSEVGLGNSGFNRSEGTTGRDSIGRAESAWNTTGDLDSSFDASNSDHPLLPHGDKLEQVSSYNPLPGPTTYNPSAQQQSSASNPPSQQQSSSYNPPTQQQQQNNSPYNLPASNPYNAAPPASAYNPLHQSGAYTPPGRQTNCYAAGYSEPASRAEYNEVAAAVAAAVMAQQKATESEGNAQSCGQTSSAGDTQSTASPSVQSTGQSDTQPSAQQSAQEPAQPPAQLPAQPPTEPCAQPVAAPLPPAASFTGAGNGDTQQNHQTGQTAGN